MKRRHLFLVSLFALAAMVLQGCSTGLMGKGNQRQTNVEIQLVSQSCFQGELVPCG